MASRIPLVAVAVCLSLSTMAVAESVGGKFRKKAESGQELTEEDLAELTLRFQGPRQAHAQGEDP
jgi:hypothetical protein